MHYRVQLFRGILQPSICSYQLSKAEHITSMIKKMILIFITSILIFSISAYLGIGNESISRNIHSWSPSEFEAHKAWFALGQVGWGVIWTAFVIFFPALLFWILTDLAYKKLVILQLFVTVILLVEKAILIPFQLKLGLDDQSSPFSLGVLAQYITNNDFMIGFFGAITLFKIGTILLQYNYLKALSDKTNKQLILIILAINLIFWIFSAMLSTINFDNLI